MKKKVKKLNLVVAIALVLVLVFTGCTKKDSKTSEVSSEPNAIVNGEDTTATQTKDLPPYEIKMAFFTLGAKAKGVPEVEAAISAITKKKFNATVKFVPIPYGSWIQQTNLMLVGNESLDLMISGVNGNYPSQVAQGQIIPLNSLIEKYGQNIMKTQYPFVMDAVKIMGEVYGIPAKREFGAGQALYVRKDIVDKYKINLSDYKTYDDLDKLFQIIKDNEPDMTPLVSTAPGSTPTDSMSGAIFDGLGDRNGSLNLTSNELKVVNMFETKEYAAMINRTRGWYNKGFIRKDEATGKETGTELIKAGRAFSYLATWKPGNEGQSSRQAGTEITSIVLTDPITDSNKAGSRFNWSIAKNSKDPDRAMMFLDLMFADKDIINLLDWGIEGRDYVKKSEETIGYPEGKDAKTVPYDLNLGYLFGDQFKSFVFETDPKDLWDETEKFNLDTKKSPAIGFNYNSESVRNEIAGVSNVMNQYKIGLETGTLDPVKALPAFISKLKEAGMDTIITEKQKQLDEWAKTKK